MSNQQEKPKGRSAPANSGTPNPAKIFIQWKSKVKAFVYYNKEKEEDVLLPMPFTFIPLYRAITVKGYNHKKTKTYTSNEIESLESDILMVNSYNSATKERKLEYKGLYKDIKEDFDQNIKFTESLYAAIKNKKGEISLVNLQLNGAGLHHWFDFVKKNDIWKAAVMVDSMTSEKNGDVNYNAPVYKTAAISEADDAAAGVLQEEITVYLKKYFIDNMAKANGAVVGQTSSSSTSATGKPKEEYSKEDPKAGFKDPLTTNFADDDDLPF